MILFGIKQKIGENEYYVLQETRECQEKKELRVRMCQNKDILEILCKEFNYVNQGKRTVNVSPFN